MNFAEPLISQLLKKFFGYMSKIGDGVELEMDLCEDCLIDKFGEELLQERSI